MDKVEVTIYRTDGNQEQRSLDKSNLLGELQTIVGGYIERIRLPLMNSYCLIVNEEGLIYDLPINPYYRRLECQPFVGDAVLMKESDFN
jgi:hypothetical protein